MRERLPAPLPSTDVARYDFQRAAVGYVATSLFLWVIWLISGAPGGLPGVEATGDQVNASFGVFPAWAMLLGFPGLMRRAWIAYAPRPDDDGGASPA